MGEALKVRRGGGAKIAEGFPQTVSGTTITIPDLINCNGFFLALLGEGYLTGYGNGNTVSVFYDGDKVVESAAYSDTYSTEIFISEQTADFDPSTGKITLDIGFFSGCAAQCVYW